jgi:hypothetical protein
MAENDKKQELQLNVNLDTTPILYTDNIYMTMNEDGLVLDVCQRMGNTNQIRIVARIGMSPSHAAKLVKQMSGLLIAPTGKTQTGKVVN